jgi:hypothetical protein
LTIPKTKDLVSLTEKKYEEIYNVMKSAIKERDSYEDPDDYTRNVNSSTTFIDKLPTAVDMKEELKNFLKMHQ